MARSPTLELELFADGGFFSPASSITTDRAEGSRRSLRKLGTRAAVRARRSGPSGDPTCTTMSRSCLVARAPADAACSSSWPAAAYLTLCLAQTYRTSLLPTWRTGCGRVCAHVWRRGSSCSPFWARASRSFCATPNARIFVFNEAWNKVVWKVGICDLVGSLACTGHISAPIFTFTGRCLLQREIRISRNQKTPRKTRACSGICQHVHVQSRKTNERAVVYESLSRKAVSLSPPPPLSPSRTSFVTSIYQSSSPTS